MNKPALFTAFVLGAALASTGCTSLLGDVDFNGTGGGSTSSSSTTGAGGSTTSSTGTGNGLCPDGEFEYPASSGKCVADPCQPDPCHGNGVCGNSTGVAVCACGPGFFGATCDSCVRFVDAAATGAKNGFTWADAFTSVQPALDTAGASVTSGAASCEVWVKAGTYHVYSTAPGDTLNLHTGVGLYGGFAGTETQRADADPTAHPTILSGHPSAAGSASVYHVITAYQVTGTTVDGFTIQGGSAKGTGNDTSGGGLRIASFDQPTSITVSRCDINGNAAKDYGGGLVVGSMGGTVTSTITDCNIHDNTAGQNGGGMSCLAGCTVTGTTFQGNSGSSGGGLHVNAQAIALSDDVFLGNFSTLSDGGGLLLQGHPAGTTFSNLFFEGNRTPGLGGAVYSLNSAVAFASSVFAGNTASAGGAIADDEPGGLTCINCTITGNRGKSQGDGIRWFNAAPTLANSIVWGNPSRVAGGTQDVYPPTWGTVITSHSDVEGYGGSDVTSFDQDPQFASSPQLFDWTTATAASAGSVVVASGAAYKVGDVLEIGRDGAARTVTQILGTTVSFSPALAAPASADVQVRDWGEAIGALDLHLDATSACIDAGDAVVAPTTDIEGHARAGKPDVGAYEHP